MKKIKNIIIANDAEAFESIIESIQRKTEQTKKIRKEHFLSNRFLFWEGDNKIIITPFPIEKGIITQAQSIGYKNIKNWYPAKIGINLCDAILKDKTLFNNLKKVVKENPSVTLSAYSYTKNLRDLITRLRKEKLTFHVDQEPQKKAEWLVNYLGSKVGFRVEMQKLQQIPKPEFFINTRKEEIIESVMWFYKKNLSSVVKAYSGEGGWGVLMLHKENYNSESELENELKSILHKDTIWNFGPYVVEELILSTKNDENSPSLEIFVNNKSSKITYICNQIIDEAGQFIGVLMGRDCLKRQIALKINRIGKIIAHRYHHLGYRGFFDIDFIVSKTGIPYPIETNVRRTGGTHVFDLTRKLFGENWAEKTDAFSSDSFQYGNNVLSVGEILEKMSEINFPMKGQKKGIILVAIDKHEPTFAFIILAPNRTGVLNIHKKLTSLWNNDTMNS